jgi:CheY-like chemotaxis protein
MTALAPDFEETFEVTDPRPAVLVVDDEEGVREMLLEILRQEGFDCVGVGDGREALGLLQSGLSPAVIVLDVCMPIMDGWEFLEQASSTVPVVVASGVREDGPLPACVVKWLIKPFGVAELTSAVRMARDIGLSARDRN